MTAHSFGTSYRLVITDINMPNLDGIDATRQIRAMRQISENTVIVGLTGHFDESFRSMAL